MVDGINRLLGINIASTIISLTPAVLLTIAVRYLRAFGNVMCCSHHQIAINKAECETK